MKPLFQTRIKLGRMTSSGQEKRGMMGKGEVETSTSSTGATVQVKGSQGQNLGGLSGDVPKELISRVNVMHVENISLPQVNLTL
jgi:hypothetical protein